MSESHYTKATWLIDLAEELGLTKNDLWRVMGIKQSNAHDMVVGKRAVPRWVSGWADLARLLSEQDPDGWEDHCEKQIGRSVD